MARKDRFSASSGAWKNAASRFVARVLVRQPPQDGMILDLGPVSYLDCVVFCILLAPQLIWRAGFLETALCVLRALPFLLVQLPIEFLWDRCIVQRESRPRFLQRASVFEDIVVRCVRYAFANIPPRIGRVFFLKHVSLPFLRFRLIRHGYWRPPIYWREHRETGLKGIWLVQRPLDKVDFVLYYAHGGGFAMGSPHFYLEFLLTWLSVLSLSGYNNPAIFALEYTLVPDAMFPAQVQETIRGYEHVLTVARDPSIVCVSGDSAGATLISSLLLHLGSKEAWEVSREGTRDRSRLRKPALALLISPWMTLVSIRHENTASDYLGAQPLHQYGMRFAGAKISLDDPLASPGCCKDEAWWKRSSPSKGMIINYGQDEVLARDIEDSVKTWRHAGVNVESRCEPGGIHAWPVASIFLSGSRDERLKALKAMTADIRERVH
ncbi:Alpha/Beta hydrolase protein [Cercophora scortea]|uniref:Alpha/Beta hydrolase protein n=1 Tax=Cercophora scortea TaxID=314031 RepID=A0AAE0MHM1_9PEZI|nr:Alpha/Beta hydrolase protein [Cercophora scortea]